MPVAKRKVVARIPVIILPLVLIIARLSLYDPESSLVSSRSSLVLNKNKETAPSSNLHPYYLPVIPGDADWEGEPNCRNLYWYTYELSHQKVRWNKPRLELLSRPRFQSMLCLLARAAKRLPPNFNTTVRICLGDAHPEMNYVFGPAQTEKAMMINPVEKSLLFPDASFESFPIAQNATTKETARQVVRAAKEYGLPGTGLWLERDARLAWRGTVRQGMVERERIINLSSPLLDVKSTTFNYKHRLLREEFCQYRFLLHMNGINGKIYSSALKWKLLCGSLVFVPTYPALFVEWWNYGVWSPFEHYVPYSSPNDLLRQVEYYKLNLHEAARIARNGMLLAQASFDNLDQFVDEMLTRYALATKDLRLLSCETKLLEKEFQSLENLQKSFGPAICA